MNRWSQVTDKIRAKLPHWWKMTRDQNSLGAQFLNVMGLTLEDVEFALDYAKDQYHIMTADIGQADIVYKGTIPSSLTPHDNMRFEGKGYNLQGTADMNTFLTGMPSDGLSYAELFYDNPYYIDWEKLTIYVRYPYDITTDYPEGSINLSVVDEVNAPVMERSIQLHIHHVWNFFDEFGLLLDTPRLYGEKNEQYIKRILDVFRHPANSSYRGLLNGIARELALTHEEIWHDDTEDFIIRRPRVVPTSVEVDGKVVAEEQKYIDESGRTILIGSGEKPGNERTVTYVSGLDAHRIGDKQDYAFQDLLYTAAGLATPLLEYYVDIITKNVPVQWGQFVFGQAFWDIATKDMSGTGFLPVILDADFSKWSSYIPKG